MINKKSKELSICVINKKSKPIQKRYFNTYFDLDLSKVNFHCQIATIRLTFFIGFLFYVIITFCYFLRYSAYDRRYVYKCKIKVKEN